jgi:hypothetical protein
MVPVDWLPPLISFPLYWVTQHQTLLAGLAAIAVGVWTVKAIRDQISSDKDLRDQERTRKLKAQLAGLPMALSRIYDYGEDCAKWLLQFLDKDGKLAEEDAFDQTFGQSLKKDLEVPAYPYDAFEVVRVTIEHASSDQSETLHELLAYAQIQKSRFDDAAAALLGHDPHSIQTSLNVKMRVLEAIGIQKHSERLFDWARSTDSEIRPLCGADGAAASRSLWSASESVGDFVRENWPPKFPRKSPL